MNGRAPAADFPDATISALRSSRPQGLARDLPFLLFADALILVAALFVSNLKGNLAEAFGAVGVLALVSLVVTAWFAIHHPTDIKCHAFLVLQGAWTYWYLVPMLLAAYRGKIYLDDQPHEFTPEQIARACVAVLLTKFVSVLVYQIVLARPVLNVERMAAWLNRRSYPMSVLPIIALLGVGLIPFLISGKEVITAILSSRSPEGIFPKSNFTGVGGGWFALTSFLTACALIGLYRFLVDQGQLRRWIFLFIAICAVLVSAIAISTRTMLLASIMPPLMFFLLGSRNRWRFVNMLVCLVALWVGADLLVSFRGRGLLQAPGAQERFSRNLVDNDFFNELVFATATVPDQAHYTNDDPTVLALITLIPRAIWPGKPRLEAEERIMRLRANYLTGDLTGNALPGIA